MEKYLWTLANGHHFTFSDLCRVYDVLPPQWQVIFGTTCDDENPLPLADAHALIGPTAQAFFDLYLKGTPDAEGLLEAVEGDEVRLESASAR